MLIESPRAASAGVQSGSGRQISACLEFMHAKCTIIGLMSDHNAAPTSCPQQPALVEGQAPPGTHHTHCQHQAPTPSPKERGHRWRYGLLPNAGSNLITVAAQEAGHERACLVLLRGTTGSIMACCQTQAATPPSVAAPEPVLKSLR